MCTSPIKIKNSSRRYRDGIDKMFFHVPCGHCVECIKRQQDDWFVRAFFEWRRIKKVGGCVFFPTFTYNDLNLPIYEDLERDFKIPCFNHSHIKSFRDKLRVYLKRAGYDAKDIRYLFCSEFGNKTKRPHYHCLLFVPFKIKRKDMLEFCKKSWIYGFTMISKKGFEINSVNAIQYVMKYISKDFVYFKNYNIDKYLSELREDVNNNVPDSEEFLKNFKSYLPKHFQSTGFGSDFVSELYSNPDCIINGKLDLSKYQFVTKNKFNFSIPRYLLRKVLFNKSFDNVDIPNDFYFGIFKDLFDKQVDNQVLSLSYLQSKESFINHFKPLEVNFDRIWKSVSVVSDMIRDLVLYDKVYKDVPLINKNIGFYDRKFLSSHAFEFALKCKFDYVNPMPEKSSASVVYPELFNSNRFTFNSLTCYRGFDTALNYIYALNRLLSRSKFDVFIQNQEKEKDNWYQSPYIKV